MTRPFVARGLGAAQEMAVEGRPDPGYGQALHAIGRGPDPRALIEGVGRLALLTDDNRAVDGLAPQASPSGPKAPVSNVCTP